MHTRHGAAAWVIIGLIALPPAVAGGDCGSCLGDLGYLFNAHIVFANPNGRVLTVRPDGNGDTLESLGISIALRLECGDYDPPLFVCDVPAAEMVLFSSSLCFCEPWHADAASDSLGRVSFSGTPRAGGCARSIAVFVDGVAVGWIPLRVNSPDTRTASACSVDQSDLPALAAKLGRPDLYDFCFDYNDDGATDAGDLAAFAQALGNGCSMAVQETPSRRR